MDTNKDPRATPRPTMGIVPFLIAGLIGVGAIAFGEADDAPGLVLFGLLILAGSVLFGVRPSLRSGSRVVGFLLAAVAVTVVGALLAGWLENNL